jgi:hypothetical protein
MQLYISIARGLLFLQMSGSLILRWSSETLHQECQSRNFAQYMRYERLYRSQSSHITYHEPRSAIPNQRRDQIGIRHESATLDVTG